MTSDFMRKKLFAGTGIQTNDLLTHVFLPGRYLSYRGLHLSVRSLSLYW